VIVEAVDNFNTLIDFRYQQHFSLKTVRLARSAAHGVDTDSAWFQQGLRLWTRIRKTVLIVWPKQGKRSFLAKGGNGG
jgi:GTP-binding protein